MDEIAQKYENGFLDEIPEVMKVQAKDRNDGKLYGLPGFFVTGEGSQNGTQSYNVRADIYEARFARYEHAG